ncbi:hypothetical protein BS17DRAFT_876966 [Gyrodon lividus]|nr:hypothetical protein BS17DRAFT_876966 [Gyrodon lividus]
MILTCFARYGARISVTFTPTESKTSAEAEEIISIDNILCNGHFSTDEVGTVSPSGRDLADPTAGWQGMNTAKRRTKAIEGVRSPVASFERAGYLLEVGLRVGNA